MTDSDFSDVYCVLSNYLMFIWNSRRAIKHLKSKEEIEEEYRTRAQALRETAHSLNISTDKLRELWEKHGPDFYVRGDEFDRYMNM